MGRWLIPGSADLDDVQWLFQNRAGFHPHHETILKRALVQGGEGQVARVCQTSDERLDRMGFGIQQDRQRRDGHTLGKRVQIGQFGGKMPVDEDQDMRVQRQRVPGGDAVTADVVNGAGGAEGHLEHVAKVGVLPLLHPYRRRAVGLPELRAFLAGATHPGDPGARQGVASMGKRVAQCGRGDGVGLGHDVVSCPSSSRRDRLCGLLGELGVASLFQLQRQFLATRFDDAAIDVDMHVVGDDVVEQALVVGNDQEAAIGAAHGVDTVGNHFQRVDVQPRVGFVQDAEAGLQHGPFAGSRRVSSRRRNSPH